MRTLAPLTVLPWSDPVDATGDDPRSVHAEEWMDRTGFAALWLLRRLADSFDRFSEGSELPVLDAARGLGLDGPDGSCEPFARAVDDLVSSGLARWPVGTNAFAVRRRLPPARGAASPKGTGAS